MHTQATVFAAGRCFNRKYSRWIDVIVFLQVIMCCGDFVKALVVAMRKPGCFSLIGCWGVGAVPLP